MAQFAKKMSNRALKVLDFAEKIIDWCECVDKKENCRDMETLNSAWDSCFLSFSQLTEKAKRQSIDSRSNLELFSGFRLI